LTPSPSAQAKNQEGILQVGGFGDQVFDVVSSFVEQGGAKDHWVSMIDSVNLNDKPAYRKEVVEVSNDDDEAVTE
jgi:hypothetical protein